MKTRPWRPIAPLPPTTDYDFSPDEGLRRWWLSHRAQIGDDRLTPLHRSWAIETGIIEGIYQLDEAQTRTLIENGFDPPTFHHPALARIRTTSGPSCRTT